MSLATRCPSCGTIFRVVQDQLKVSEGWVRCGQCHEVFHGIEALFDLDSDPAIAARRAAARLPAAPPPTRVFAEQRANAPIPLPTTPPAPAPTPSPIAIPARPSAPVTTGRQSVQATPSAFGPSGLPPVAPGIRPGYTGFTPVARTVESPPPLPSAPPAPLSTSPIAPLATRGTIAPRFAARLAEESAARAQAPLPIATAPAPHVSLADPPAPVFDAPPPADPLPEWSAAAESAQTTPSPPVFAAPAFVPESIAAPMTAPAMPAFEAPPESTPAIAPAPVPARAETPLVTPIAMSPAPAEIAPSAAELASAFAAPAARAVEPATAPATAEEIPPAHTPDIDGATVRSLATEDAAADHDEDEEARAGPPTLASMLPEDAGDWPPRRPKKRVENAVSTSTEVALVDRTKDPRFLREARSGARWRKPWVRAVLSVALVLLVAAAVGQVAWPLRDTIASRWPVTVPAWDWVCAQADCRIEAPRAIASLALDGSSLTRTDTDHVLLFSADLHNRADHDVRMPSFDVTFMDLNGEIVARKVLAPEQLGIHQAALPADGELHVHARLQVGTLPATGFQADLFYP